jgi:carbonic anhydrase
MLRISPANLLLFVLMLSSVTPMALAQDGVSAEDALSLLKGGNERFVSGHMQDKNYSHERPKLAQGQHPYAIILACADSRVSPEIIFDESLGRLFTIRVAGNVADPVVLGSIEYAVEHLHANLLVVLGHEGCGAVKATLSGSGVPPNIEAIVKRITPAAEKIRVQRLDEKAMLSAAIRENVKYQMHMAMFDSEIIAESFHRKKLKIMGGVYNLQTGHVDLIPMDDTNKHGHHESQHTSHSNVNPHADHYVNATHSTPHTSHPISTHNYHSQAHPVSKPVVRPKHVQSKHGQSKPHSTSQRHTSSHSTSNSSHHSKTPSSNHTKSKASKEAEHDDHSEPKKKVTSHSKSH